MALRTSGNYSFQSITSELVIRDAYERIGILGDLLTAQQLDSASRSMNFLLTEWSNRNLNFWVLNDLFISLVPGVNTYTLPIQVIKVLQAELRISTRQLNGTAFSSEQLVDDATAEDAFNNLSIPCIQDSIDGFISYDYGANNSQVINFVGIQPEGFVNYDIFIEASNDNITWIRLLGIYVAANPIEETIFTSGVNQWFDLNNILPFRYYRVRVENGTLSIQKIYFSNNVTDFAMSEISRYEYLTYPQKSQLGRPSVFYVDYQIVPVLHVWQNPTAQYNAMFVSVQEMIQTVNDYTSTMQIPSSFYQPLVAGLAWKLAEKYAPERIEAMKGQYEQSMSMAVIKDSAELPLTLGVYAR
jgi:hypothetical protein